MQYVKRSRVAWEGQEVPNGDKLLGGGGGRAGWGQGFETKTTFVKSWQSGLGGPGKA